MLRSLLVPLIALMALPTLAADAKVPVIHSTDLFHPHEDPDDHYDLACLFAIEEFDLKGIILDLGGLQAQKPGRPAVEQMMAIAGRRCPVAVGLSRPLRSRDDAAREEPAEFQGAVDLIVKVLRESPEKVVLHTTGSCRDVAAAFNREPELLRQKVRAVYFNIGRGPNEPQEECNVGYDPAAYLRLFESGLPIYWCPCFGKDGYETLFSADQTAVVGACDRRVQNFFVYCLTHSQADPLAFLETGPHPLPTGPRAMWCTAPMLHAAGRKVFERAPGDFVALSPAAAATAGLAKKEVATFEFVPMRAALAAPPKVDPSSSAEWLGQTADRVGTAKPEPDGRPDCAVRVRGVANGPIKNLVLTGPNQGRWELVETGRWWRLAYQRDRDALTCYFQFYAAGEHRLEIVHTDGTTQIVKFVVPGGDNAILQVALRPDEPNGYVFHSIDPRYKAIMASCLKNLLAGLGRR